MKIILLTLALFTFPFFLKAQKIIPIERSPNLSSIGLKIIGEKNILTNKGLKSLNNLLQQHYIVPLKTDYLSQGFGISILQKKGKILLDFDFESFSVHPQHKMNASDTTAPSISGKKFKIAFLKKLFDKNRCYATSGLGLSVNAITLNQLVTQVVNSPFSTNTATYNRYNYSVEALLGITYRTQLFKSIFRDVDINAQTGYVFELKRSTSKPQWSASNSFRTVVPNVPNINLDNLFFQINFNFILKKGSSNT